MVITANAVQTVAANQDVLFTNVDFLLNLLIFHILLFHFYVEKH